MVNKRTYLKFKLIPRVLLIYFLFFNVLNGYYINQEFVFKTSLLSNKYSISNSDTLPWGDVQIFSVILNKTDIIIGEPILINASYRILLTENWSVYHILFGIRSEFSFLGKSMPRTTGNLVEISETFYFEPYSINYGESYYGYLEIVVYDVNNPGNKATITKTNNYSIRFEKAPINSEIIYQFPKIIFSFDNVNMTFKFTNAVNNTYVFSNQEITFRLSGINILYYHETTDENGIANLVLNTSLMKTDICTLTIIINETEVYQAFQTYYVLDILNETEEFYFSFENKTNLYTNIGLNDSNSLVNLKIYCGFDAKVYLNDSGKLIELSNKSGNYYYEQFSTPNRAGFYKINLIAVPNLPGNNLSLSKSYEIKRRPININYNISRDSYNQRKLIFNLSIVDLLTGTRLINEKINLYYFNIAKNNWTLIKSILIDAPFKLFEWNVPDNYTDSELMFNLTFESNNVFESFSDTKDLILSLLTTNLQKFFPLSTEIMLEFKLNFLNGTPIVNQTVNIYIGEDLWALKTDSNGLIKLKYLTPEKETIIQITIIYNGPKNVSYLIYQDVLNIRMNIEQRLFYNIGYILTFIMLSLGTITVLTKIKKPKMVSDIKIK
ncbi:MAG: hypothetical protein ACTSRP_03875 [Candidatus Helarchaeota archaeon]